MPRTGRGSQSSREHISLDAAAALTQPVRTRRELFYGNFVAWAEAEVGCKFVQLSSSGLLLGTALVAFGKFLFYGGLPKYMYSETINAVADRFRHFRAHFQSAWNTLSRWEEEEPSERAMIMPESVFLAAISVGLAWGWPLFVAALLLGFHGMLRPSEFLTLSRQDLILPRDLLSDHKLAFVRILRSKTKRFLQRQHAKISDATAVGFLEAIFGPLHPDCLLFNCSLNVFRRRWDAVFSFLHIPTGESCSGVTPKALRGSGATWFYQRTEDIERIQWRGRWQQRRTLEHYLQDVAGQLLLAGLSESHRHHIKQLALLAPAALGGWIVSVP